MKSRLSVFCLFALLALAAARPAAAENEAYYFPDGTLYVPHVKMQDHAGDTVARYAAFFQKRAGWNFKLYGLSEVAAPAPGVSTNYVTSYVTNYVSISNYVIFTNYTYITNVYDGTNIINTTTSVYITTNVYVETNVNITTNILVVTNVPPATASVAGTWQFQFGDSSFDRIFTSNGFDRTYSMDINFRIMTLALTQAGTDVSGTGLVDTVQYALTGEVTNDFFVFTMLAGYTNKTINLVAGQALVGDGRLEGEYYWSSSNGATVNGGNFSAEKQ